MRREDELQLASRVCLDQKRGSDWSPGRLNLPVPVLHRTQSAARAGNFRNYFANKLRQVASQEDPLALALTALLARRSRLRVGFVRRDASGAGNRY